MRTAGRARRARVAEIAGIFVLGFAAGWVAATWPGEARSTVPNRPVRPPETPSRRDFVSADVPVAATARGTPPAPAVRLGEDNADPTTGTVRVIVVGADPATLAEMKGEARIDRAGEEEVISAAPSGETLTFPNLRAGGQALIILLLRGRSRALGVPVLAGRVTEVTIPF
ncbi:MAG: hypothetical protein MUE73_20620, partial [Planctomycetes bacterium]|nr:hypothetical protein [Planctomycetota bacterium]